MDAKPGSSSEGSAPEPGAAGGRDSAVERYGPLELRRLRKDDGRHLIVYTRVEPPLGDEASRPPANPSAPAS